MPYMFDRKKIFLVVSTILFTLAGVTFLYAAYRHMKPELVTPVVQEINWGESKYCEEWPCIVDEDKYMLHCISTMIESGLIDIKEFYPENFDASASAEFYKNKAQTLSLPIDQG